MAQYLQKTENCELAIARLKQKKLLEAQVYTAQLLNIKQNLKTIVQVNGQRYGLSSGAESEETLQLI